MRQVISTPSVGRQSEAQVVSHCIHGVCLNVGTHINPSVVGRQA
jgi:hypothetical protein